MPTNLLHTLGYIHACDPLVHRTLGIRRYKSRFSLKINAFRFSTGLHLIFVIMPPGIKQHAPRPSPPKDSKLQTADHQTFNPGLGASLGKLISQERRYRMHYNDLHARWLFR